MAVLGSILRAELERAVGVGRGVAERGAAGGLTRLGIVDSSPPVYLSEPERELRRGLRARARQLGDSVVGDIASGVPLLMAEVAYEQWHRILFARFLEANGLLMHPEFGASVTLEECGEFAAGLGEPDAWSVAARFASEILPGIFRPDDPSVLVRLAPEDLLGLERVVAGLPEETFLAEDSLGWVYQFWQSKQKKAVNDSGRKIGGADISPVTQLFTEDYMVRFLLENSLGAWWAGKHPESPLLAGYEFLRFDDDGVPSAGTFEGWPDRVAEVTVMDPCCGSGHFLVAAFGMLWRMRAEEEALSPAVAQDAVLRENLFGLELDSRCTQLAMFALALEAWKQGGYRALPVPNVACSGIPAKGPLAEWTKLADRDYKLEAALTRLHELFRDADTLGSLIDPVRVSEQAGLESVDWDTIAPLLTAALEGEASKTGDPAAEVFGQAAAGIARAAQLLSRKYTLIATNPPYLGAGKQSETLRRVAEEITSSGNIDLAMTMVHRFLPMLDANSTIAMVLPDTWRYIPSYSAYRKEFLIDYEPVMLAGLGPRAFQTQMFDYPIGLLLADSRPGRSGAYSYARFEVASPASPQLELLRVKSARSTDLGGSATQGEYLTDYVSVYEGLSTGDGGRYIRKWWEQNRFGDWGKLQVRPESTAEWSGAQDVVWWRSDGAALLQDPGARIQGLGAVGRSGVLVERQKPLRATLYLGNPFFKTTVAIVPKRSGDFPAVWAYCSSDEYRQEVRSRDPRVGIATSSTVNVPFDVERWRSVAEQRYPHGLPEPQSDDPTQWLFRGGPAGSTDPLQVAVARLLGFRWPEQAADAVDALVNDDGIVCLPAISGERGAAERVRTVLAASFDSEWSNSRMDELLVAAGGRGGDLEGWLRDVFFKHHTKVFQNRPFVWHVWDGRADGFSALVNYHRLTRQTLEKLTYTTLGWWIDRQRADARADVPGAAARLAAAEALQAKLMLILDGEPPLDTYVRWKSLAQQSIGWDPDLDDGVRMNIRPFVEAKILRTTFTINWRKDRGTNPDGSERHNDLHYTREQKEKAR